MYLGRVIETCDCGHELPRCEGCGGVLYAGDSGASAYHGRLCRGCCDVAFRRRGRCCNACIRRTKAELGPGYAYRNDHPMRHSTVLDTCVDRELVQFLEGFNINVAPTFSSCQGVLALPAAEFKLWGKWARHGAPFISVIGKYADPALAWVKQHGSDHQVSDVRWATPEQRYSTVAISFRDVPTWVD